MKKSAQPKAQSDNLIYDNVREAVLDDLYDNMYRKRKQIYAVNFVRGLFFGAGSAVGGTLVIALLVWILSWFVNWPLVGELLDMLRR